MVEIISTINGKINSLVWGLPMMILIVGTGVLMSCGIGFKQFTKIGYWMKNTIGKALKKQDTKEGAVTPFQAMCTALAASVGTGNIAGVGGAIAIGGPGAVFWMWLSALVGMATKYAEVTLALHYREKNSKGDWVGGPMYYIKNGLGKNWKWLGSVFCVFAALAAFGIGNMTQVNTIASTVTDAMVLFAPTLNVGTAKLFIGVALAILAAIILIGGIKRIGQVCEKLVPVMAIIYIIAGIGVVVMNLDQVPVVFGAIIKGAFNPEAAAGGLVGVTIMTAIKKGVGRGVFSNEAGLGSAPIAHAAADVDDPVKQGLFGMFEVFADTIVICTLTAFIVLCGNGINGIEYGNDIGAGLTINGLKSLYDPTIATVLVAVALTLFAFSTVLTWALYGSRSVEYLLGTKAIVPYQVVFCLFMIVGATMKIQLAWDIADTLNGLMALPNLIALIALSPVVFKLTKDHFAKNK
ncbi:MAG: sodium:alanine symporter family protein [Oscillospiraceae bacterium]|nr:sodium:alanine symporter family protein [Oscillospiraceae bacterium]